MTGRFDPALIPSAPDLSLEIPLWTANVLQVAGIDEVGRGALAGPVTAAALILPPEPRLVDSLYGVRDSKELTPEDREVCALRLRQAALAWGIGFASPAEIDALGIVRATQLAALRALETLPVTPQHLLLDYLFLEESSLPQTSLIKGDSRSLSIAGASILAKTARDALLRELDACHPGYGFAAHKGYCTPGHLEALARLGPCAIHRRSFAPVRLSMASLEAVSEEFQV